MGLYGALKNAADNGEYFTTREWNFEHKNMKNLLGALSDADKIKFVLLNALFCVLK